MKCKTKDYDAHTDKLYQGVLARKSKRKITQTNQSQTLTLQTNYELENTFASDNRIYPKEGGIKR